MIGMLNGFEYSMDYILREINRSGTLDVASIFAIIAALYPKILLCDAIELAVKVFDLYIKDNIRKEAEHE